MTRAFWGLVTKNEGKKNKNKTKNLKGSGTDKVDRLVSLGRESVIKKTEGFGQHLAENTCTSRPQTQIKKVRRIMVADYAAMLISHP